MSVQKKIFFKVQEKNIPSQFAENISENIKYLIQISRPVPSEGADFTDLLLSKLLKSITPQEMEGHDIISSQGK